MQRSGNRRPLLAEKHALYSAATAEMPGPAANYCPRKCPQVCAQDVTSAPKQDTDTRWEYCPPPQNPPSSPPPGRHAPEVTREAEGAIFWSTLGTGRMEKMTEEGICRHEG